MTDLRATLILDWAPWAVGLDAATAKIKLAAVEINGAARSISGVGVQSGKAGAALDSQLVPGMSAARAEALTLGQGLGGTSLQAKKLGATAAGETTVGLKKAKGAAQESETAFRSSSRALADAEAKASQLGLGVTGLGGRLQGLTGLSTEAGTGILGMSSAMTAGAAAGAALVAMVGVKAVHAYDAHEAALIQVQNAFRNNRALVAANITDFDQLADSLQRVTGVSRDEINAAAAVGARFAQSGDQLRAMIPLAVDLSVKLGVDVPTAMGMLGKASEGSLRPLKALGINTTAVSAQLKGMTRESDRLQLIMGLLQPRVSGLAGEMGKTFSGQLHILEGQLRDLFIQIGSDLVPVLTTFTHGLNDLAPALKAVGLAGKVLGTEFEYTFLLPFKVGPPIIHALGDALDWLDRRFGATGRSMADAAQIGAVYQAQMQGIGGRQRDAELSVRGFADAVKSSSSWLDTLGTAVDVAGVRISHLQQIQGTWIGAGKAAIAEFARATGTDLNTFVAGAQAAAAKGGRAWNQFLDQTASKFSQWHDQLATSFNFVEGDLSNLAGKSHLTATDILKDFDSQLKAMTNYQANWDAIVKAGAPKSLLDQLAQMGSQGQTIVAALAHANKSQFDKIVGDWNTAGGKAGSLATDIQTTLVGSIDSLIAAIEGIPDWHMRVDTTVAQQQMDAFMRGVWGAGIIIPNASTHQPFASGGWVPGSGSDDTVAALLTPGEFVVPKDKAARHAGLLEVIRRYADGGFVSNYPDAASTYSGFAASMAGIRLPALIAPIALRMAGGGAVPMASGLGRGMTQWVVPASLINGASGGHRGGLDPRSLVGLEIRIKDWKGDLTIRDWEAGHAQFRAEIIGEIEDDRQFQKDLGRMNPYR
jgi:hypothetical protein